MNLIRNSLLALSLMMAGCVSCNPKAPTVKPDVYENITADNIVSTCLEPADYYFIPGGLVVDTPMKVIRFKDCLSQPDLLIMSFPGENTEINRSYVHLMMLLYIDSVRETTGAHLDWSLIRASQLTKVDGKDITAENEVWFIIYKLSPKVVETAPTDTAQ